MVANVLIYIVIGIEGFIEKLYVLLSHSPCA